MKHPARYINGPAEGRSGKTDNAKAVVKFDSTHHPRHLRISKFEEYVRGGPLHLMKAATFRPLNSDSPDVHVIERLLAEHCFLSFVETTGYRVKLDGLPKLDKRHDTITLSHLRKGDAEVRTAQDCFTLRAGDMCLHATRDFESTYGETKTARLIFPAGSMKALFRRSGEFVVLRDHEPVSQVLKATISGLESALRGDKNASTNLLSRMAVELASKVIEDNILRSAANGYDTSGYDIIRERAREYIHDNIASPGLNVDEIAVHVSASRATLYRAFEGLGGVRDYITFVRVERAKSLLGTGTPDRGGVSAIAYACGFSSAGQMGKAFKSRYGVSPTQFGTTVGKR